MESNKPKLSSSSDRSVTDTVVNTDDFTDISLVNNNKTVKIPVDDRYFNLQEVINDWI